MLGMLGTGLCLDLIILFPSHQMCICENVSLSDTYKYAIDKNFCDKAIILAVPCIKFFIKTFLSFLVKGPNDLIPTNKNSGHGHRVL